MHSSAPLILSPEDKLDLLRYLDEGHFWRTLEDERRCARCHEVITGRQVLVFERRGTRGRLGLQCPTVGCNSSASDWDYVNELRAKSMRKRTRLDGRQKLPPKPELSHQGRAGGLRPKRPRLENAHDAPRVLPPWEHFFRIFKANLARSPVLRSIATGLHGIHPLP